MTDIKSVATIALVCLAFPGAAWLRAEDRMRPGLWDVVSTYNGEPSGTQGNTCYTPEMVAFGNRPAPELRDATEKMATKRGCSVKDFKIDGKTMSMTKSCGAKTSVITSTSSGNAFETVDKSTTAGVTAVMHITGRRVGDCK